MYVINNTFYPDSTNQWVFCPNLIKLQQEKKVYKKNLNDDSQK